MPRTGDAVDPQFLLDHHQRGEQLADLFGQLGVAGGIFLDTRPLAGPVPRQERLGDDLEGVAINGWLAPGQRPWLEQSPGRLPRA